MKMSYHATERLSERHIETHEVEALATTGSHWHHPTDDNIHFARLGDLFGVFYGPGYWLATAYRLEN